MAQLITQFEVACSNIEPEDSDKSNAMAAHEAVRDVLDGHPDLKDKGIDTVLIGSYKRHVSIRRVKDVDVLSRCDVLDMTGGEALDLFAEILGSDEAFGSAVERQDRSIKVEFPEFDLHVDAVPARPCGKYWEIPDPDGGWVETNPEELTELSSRMNEDNQNLYVPIVKLIRQTRRAHLGKHPGGLFFEVLSFHAFAAGLPGENRSEMFVQALRGVADQLADVVNGGEIEDPTMDGAYLSVKVTAQEMAEAASVFASLAADAEKALGQEKCAAALTFRTILGRRDDDQWVFPMPAGCNDDGTPVLLAASARHIPGERQVPAGDRRFA